MKHIKFLIATLTVLAAMLVTLPTMGQDEAAQPAVAVTTVDAAPAPSVEVSESPADTSNYDWVQSALTSLGGVKGANTWAIILILSQLVMGFLNTKWAASISWLTGNVKFVTASFFTLIIGPVTAITQGMQPSAAFGTGLVVTGVVKLVFEIYDRFFKKAA